MRVVHVLLATLLLASSGIHAGAPKVVGDPKRADEIQQLFDAWIAAQKSRDFDRVMAVYDKGVMLSLQGAVDRNYEEIAAGFKKEFSMEVQGTWSAILEETYADKNLTVAVSLWEYRKDTVLGANTLMASFRSVDTLRKSGKDWKIVRSINYPLEAD